VTTLLIIYYMVVVPIRIGFMDTTLCKEDGNGGVLRGCSAWVQGTDGWYVMDFFADLIFLVDLAMNFRTVIKVPGSDYITDPKVIAKYYVVQSGWFWPDLVASLPTTFFFPPEDNLLGFGCMFMCDEDTKTLRSANRLLRMARIFKLFRVFRMFRLWKDIENLAVFNPSSLRLMRLVCIYVIIIHYVSCFYWSILAGEDGNDFCDDMSPQSTDLCNVAWTMPRSEVYRNDNSTIDFGAQYNLAFFWGISVTAGVGYDIEPQTQAQTTYTTICVMIGVVLNALIIGSVPGAYENLDHYNKERKRELDTINDYLRKQGVPNFLQKSVRSYFEYLHSCDYDVKVGEELLLEHLPESLRMRVRVAISIQAIEKIPLFKDLNAICKITIIQKLQAKVAVPGEYLAVQDYIGEHMFILKNGKVHLKRTPTTRQKWGSAISKIMNAKKETAKMYRDERKKLKALNAQNSRREMLNQNNLSSVSTGSDNNWGAELATAQNAHAEQVVAELRTGDFFGENAILDRKHDTSAIAAEYCDLLMLGIDDVEEICESHPDLHENIVLVAKERYEEHVPANDRIKGVFTAITSQLDKKKSESGMGGGLGAFLKSTAAASKSADESSKVGKVNTVSLDPIKGAGGGAVSTRKVTPALSRGESTAEAGGVESS